MRAASLVATVAILALTGCGGGSAAPHHRVHLTAFERHGRALFISNCGICHALAQAGTTYTAGPALDSPWEASRVREIIADAPGAMPSHLLLGQDAAAVAAYVAAATK